MRHGLRIESPTGGSDVTVAQVEQLAIILERGGVLVTAGSSFLPGEAIRISLSGLSYTISFGAAPLIKVIGQDGTIHLEKRVNKNLAGNAWVNFVTPQEEGQYTVEGDAPGVFPGQRVFAYSLFSVDKNAPPLPKRDGGFFKGLTGSINSLTTLALVGGVVYLGITLFGKRK